MVASNTYRRATEVGDGSLDYMFAYWRELMKEEPNVARPSADFANIPLPTASLFPTLSNFTTPAGANPSDRDSVHHRQLHGAGGRSRR